MFVDNLVDAMVTVLRRERLGRSTYVLNDGSDFSTPNLVRALAAAAGCRDRLVPFPVSALRIVGYAAGGLGALMGRPLVIDSAGIDRLVGSLHVDGSRFRREFGWQPPIGIEQAFRQMGDSLSGNRPAAVRSRES